jgi:alpha-L-fucosidase
VENYRPDLLYIDDFDIPAPAMEACKLLHENSLKQHGSIETIITTKKAEPRAGTILDFEKGIADGMKSEYWQTDTSMNGAWFLKKEADKDNLSHNARTLKELLVDIVSKRGVLMLNLAINHDGSIPADQFAIMEEFGAWLNINSEAIHETEPWKIYGEGGESAGGNFNERTINSTPWSHDVHRFTCNKDKKTLYIHIFGNPAGRQLTIGSLADKSLFAGTVEKISLLGSPASVEWSMQSDGLHINMPAEVPFNDCNVLKVQTTGL